MQGLSSAGQNAHQFRTERAEKVISHGEEWDISDHETKIEHDVAQLCVRIDDVSQPPLQLREEYEVGSKEPKTAVAETEKGLVVAAVYKP